MIPTIVSGVIGLAVGIVIGVLWGRKHPSEADFVAKVATDVKQKF